MSLSSQTLHRNGLSPTPPDDHLRRLRSSRRALSNETRFRKRSKHIALRWHFIDERQDPQVADLKVIHRRRTKMLADIFASPRAAPTFIAFRDHILGHQSGFVADDDE
jgi:hypothetical protein